MTQRAKYAYRLLVEYPSEPPPEREGERNDGYDDAGYWHWPAVRTTLTKRSAEKRAALLRSYGCLVEVERSNPITFGPQ